MIDPTVGEALSGNTVGPVDQSNGLRHDEACRLGNVRSLGGGRSGGRGVFEDGDPVTGHHRPDQPPPDTMGFL